MFSLTILSSILLHVVLGENSVQLKADMQKVTSSTLKWVAPNDELVPENAVVGSVEYTPIGFTENDLSQISTVNKSHIKESKIHICRAFLNGNWVPGALYEHTPACIVSVFVQVYEQKKYEILQNVDQAARLIWKDWEKHEDIPKGAVSVGGYFIAHSPSPRIKIFNENVAVGTSFLIGNVDPNEGLFGRMSVVDEDKRVITDVGDGQVLIEIEPVLYELTIKKLTTARRKIPSKKELLLGDTTLRNDEAEEMKADAMITFNWKYMSSWGQGKAMLKGLPTSIYFVNSTSVENITWGIRYDEDRNGIEKVEAWLEPGTATHVQLLADYQEVEVPYTALLLSVFSDSTMMNRTVHGTWKYSSVSDIRAIYGPAYFIHNSTFVPTTTTTTTTESPTTTTTTTTAGTTTIVNNEITQTLVSESVKPTINAMPPVKEEQPHNMLRDESDAMQLKKKDESDKTGSANNVLVSRNTLFGLLLITLFRYSVNRT